jgi:very-short-patch-repair endonuclease
VIELDGEVHNEKAQIDYDVKRDEFMKNLGLNILRIRNEDLYYSKEKVLQLILKNL